ncbi:MAG: tRNA-dihydrouridine synthase [Candidatus Rokubacteria bacterium]|nr:tRNA-dihydrouridine synthase [Candidatus Rokubacteria bacterium]
MGFGLLTYTTVRTSARPCDPMPNILFCDDGNPARAGSRRAPAEATLAVSLGMPSMEPEVWRKDVRRAKERIGAGQILLVGVVGTPVPDGGAEALVEDYARCARWAVEAGANIVEVHLACPNPAAGLTSMVCEDLDLSARIVEAVRRAAGGHPTIAKLGTCESPRRLHELASTLAPWVDGFILVDGLQRRVVSRAGAPAFPGPGRELARVVGADTHETCRRHVEELLAWRKAGAWDKVVLAAGGITTTERARRMLGVGADAVMVATAALLDPGLAVRFRQARVSSA